VIEITSNLNSKIYHCNIFRDADEPLDEMSIEQEILYLYDETSDEMMDCADTVDQGRSQVLQEAIIKPSAIDSLIFNLPSKYPLVKIDLFKPHPLISPVFSVLFQAEKLPNQAQSHSKTTAFSNFKSVNGRINRSNFHYGPNLQSISSQSRAINRDTQFKPFQFRRTDMYRVVDESGRQFPVCYFCGIAGHVAKYCRHSQL